MFKKSLHSPCGWNCEIIFNRGCLETTPLHLRVIDSYHPRHLSISLRKTTFGIFFPFNCFSVRPLSALADEHISASVQTEEEGRSSKAVVMEAKPVRNTTFECLQEDSA